MAMSWLRLVSVPIALVTILASDRVAAQTPETRSWAHVQVRGLEVLTLDRDLLTVDAFAVVEADPPGGLTDADLAVLRGELQAAARSAAADTLAVGDVDAVSARMAPALARAAEARDLRLLTHGIATIRPTPEMVARIASRLTAEAERARRLAEAERQSIEAEAAARAARIDAEAAARVARIGADVDAEAGRILTTAASADPMLYAFWSSRLLVDGWAADRADAGAVATDDPFGAVDALMAACLAPLVVRGHGVADPTKAQSLDRSLQPKQAAGDDTTWRIMVTVPVLNADWVVADVVVAVELLQQHEAAADDATLLADFVSAATTQALHRLSLEQAMDRRAALSDALYQAVDDMVGASGRRMRVDSLALQAVTLDDRLAEVAFDPALAAALIDEVRATAQTTVDLAEAGAREARLAAEARADRARQEAQAEAARFGLFLERYRAEPDLTAHLFCHDLVEGVLLDD